MFNGLKKLPARQGMMVFRQQFARREDNTMNSCADRPGDGIPTTMCIGGIDTEQWQGVGILLPRDSTDTGIVYDVV